MCASRNIKSYLLATFAITVVLTVTHNMTATLFDNTFKLMHVKMQPSRRQLVKPFEAEKSLININSMSTHLTDHRSKVINARSCRQKDQVDEAVADLDCKKRLPQVIGIGVEKCGTSALSFFLNSHPNFVHSVPQEIYYWNRNQNESLDWYRDKMPVTSKHEITMEKTPSYIFNLTVPTRIKAVIPDVKFVVIIRDPVVRAVSDYLHLLDVGWPEFFKPRVAALGKEPLCYLNATFESSVIRPNGEVNSDNAILVHGAYVIYLREWLKVFPRNHFFVIDGDAFIKNPLPTLQEMETFLGLPKFFDEKSVYFDKQKGFYCKAKPVHICAGKVKGRPHPEVDNDVIRKLREYYSSYDAELELLLGRTFSWIQHNEG